MNIVVTGATGFVGKFLCRELAAHGHTVTTLTRNAGQAGAALPDLPATHLEWQASNWPRHVADSDAIVHLAGASVGAKRWTPAFRQEILTSRTDTTRAVVEALGRANSRCKILLCASAVGYYGDTGDRDITEADGPGTDFLADVCVQWERETLRAEGFGVRVCRMRTGVVLGPGGSLERLLRPLPFLPLNPYKLGLGGPLGDGRQWFPWVHLHDAAALYRHALETTVLTGPVNVTAPHPVTNREFARALGCVYRRPAVLPVPGFVLKLVLGSFAASILTGQKVLPQAALQSGFSFQWPHADGALANLLT